MTDLEWQALMLSLKVAGWATVTSLPFAVGAAWLLARCSFPGKTLFDGIVHLPLVLPPVAVGYLLLVLLGRNSLVGGFLEAHTGLTFVFSWRGAALAAAVMAFPLMVRSIRLSIESMDRGLEVAARTLGANRSRVFFTIVLPLISPGLITGIVLGFTRSLGEFGATISFAANVPGETRTIPLAMFTALEAPGGEAAAFRLAMISIGVAVFTLVASTYLARFAQRRLLG
jgi:molybdate transport system permease protein